MDFEDYLEKGKAIYQRVLEFIDSVENQEINFDDLQDIIDSQSIIERKEDIIALFYLINSIANNHNRSPDFIRKIEQILKHFQSKISNLFTNFEIFNIFKSNKRILLFLFEEGIVKIDKSIAFILSNGWYKKANYHFYFYPEIKNFLNENQLQKMSNKTIEMNEVNSDDFESNRKIGENHRYICKLIQKDEIQDFIVYVNKNNYWLENPIAKSIYETNSYLLNKETITLIEYAAFYGSIQIFQYLYLNKINVSPLLWFYSIHGRNPEIIHLLENYQIIPFDKSFNECLHESIKCHHNELASYFQNNFVNNTKGISISIKYYNYEFFQNDLKFDEISFYYACKYNNIFLVKYILQNFKININAILTDENIHQPALNAAIKERNIEIVELLLSSRTDIDVNIKSFLLIEGIEESKRLVYKKEKSPLHIAVCEEDEKIVELLLANPNIDVNAISKYYDKTRYPINNIEKTALNIAIEKENVKIVSLLLNHPKIDVNYISKHNDSNYGLEKGHDRFIEKIPLIIAVEKENIEIISLLLNHPKIDVNIISRYHDYEYEKFYGYRGNQYKERTALSISIEKNNVEIVKLLLEHSEIDLNYRLLFCNSNHSDENEDKYKTNHYFYIDDYDGDSFDDVKIEENNNYLSIHNDILLFDEIKSKLIFSRSFIKEMKTPLFISVKNKNVDIVNLLLNCQKIDVNYTSFIKSVEISDEISPLTKSIKDGSIEITQLLKKHNAVEINTKFRDKLDLLI